MSDQDLSPRDIALAQRRFTVFTALNVVSFQLLSGNIITLFALRLEASNFLIGLLYSFLPVAQLLPILGRSIVARIGAVRTMSIFWFVRYGLMAPILFAPLFASNGRPDIGIVLIVVSVVGFNLARGIGITGHNPVVAGITTERDRGSFLARNQLVIHSGAILVGVSTALLLGAVSSLFIYAILIASGIASGIGAAVVVSKLPEPRSDISRGRTGLIDGLRLAGAISGFRRFVVVLGLKSFLIAMALPFLVVYLKRVHDVGDSTVVIFTVIGSIGAIGMALISGLAIDSTGPKPVSQVFGAVLLVALLLVIVIPGTANSTLFWVLAGLVFFLTTMGANGLENGLSNYFFRLIPAEEVLNIGIVNFLVSGAAATIGSLAGGAALDGLESSGLSAADAFRFYYGGLVAVLVVLLVVVTSLPRLGPAFTGRDVMAMFLSPRDLHAMGLLRRLRRGGTRQPDADLSAIRALGQTRSALSTSQLLVELDSPRFSLRSEALSALSSANPSTDVNKALMEQVRTQEFTTAYRAAEILGRNGATESIPTLREALGSSDYFLCGKSMVALAKLGDRESLGRIGAIIEETNNPRVIIHGAAALEILGDPSSVPVLITKLKKRLSGFVRDEVNLSLSVLLGLQDMYYPLFLSFIESKGLGVAGLKDYIAERLAAGATPAVDPEQLRGLANATNGDDGTFSDLAEDLLTSSVFGTGLEVAIPSLVEAVRDPDIVKLSRFRFLLAAFVLHAALSSR